MIDLDGQTHAERLATEIADAILSGRILPGTHLDEKSLAVQFGVSRTPVREALRQLGNSGLIDLRPHKGATVTKVTPAKLEEMFCAMAEVEATCARLAAISMTPIERRRLDALHHSMGVMVQNSLDDRYIEANVAFHGAIYAGAHNGIIHEFAMNLRRRLSPFRRAQFQKAGRLAESHAEHGFVARAILHADAPAAHAAMLHHVSLVELAFDELTVPRFRSE
jgi:DNA-binding GntR family transcriptional regulator